LDGWSGPPNLSPKHQDGSHAESNTKPSSPSAVTDLPTKTKGLKRSFLARFLEDEDELPAQKAKDEVEKGLHHRILEQVFGICDADPKQGRDASRLIHPQSAFATGSLDSPISRMSTNLISGTQRIRPPLIIEHAG
jgi:hypothetical protein